MTLRTNFQNLTGNRAAPMNTAPTSAVPQTPTVNGVRPQMIDVSSLAPERAVAMLIDHAVSMGASDLFFVSNEQHVAVMVRHLGMMLPISVEDVEQGRRLLSHIRNMSGMDLNDRRRPADGRWIYVGGGQGASVLEGQSVDLRINTIPTLYGEDMAVRLLVRGQALYSLDRLGMSPEQLQQYSQMVSSVGGLVLITGPTGSGKTATLYSSLIHLNDGKRKINTIEDPFEYAVDGLRQSQVNVAIDLGFAELLRSILRQSPDVIMIGEIRDEATAKTAVHAANSGILVLATIHAPNCAATIQSMRALGVPNHFLAACLRGVVSQRLLRTLDPATRASFDISHAPETFEEIRKYLGPGEGQLLYAAVPGESNRMTGYSGRVGVFEVMPISREIRTMITTGVEARDIREKAIADGMLPFRHAAMLNVARGVTSAEEVFRVIPTDVLLDDEK